MATPSLSDDAVRLVSLGGAGDIGKNLTLVEQADSMLAIDCGLMFPDEEHPGVDVILPNMDYILENADRLAGVVLTHGHEDHLGALPYLLEQMPLTVYGTRLTLGLLEARLQEFHPQPGYELVTITPGEKLTIGDFGVEVIRVNHSIPDAVGLAIGTAAGTVVFSGDFKFDQTPINSLGADLQGLARLGAEGVLCLLCDCTNVERPGYSPSERVVGETLRGVFRDAPGRVIVTTFASNVGRIQQILDQALATGRKVAITGRSMERMVSTAQRLGYLTVPTEVLIGLEEMAGYPHERVVVVTTGSQGEPLSALARMSRRAHKQVKVAAGDTVVMSATPIPGNESLIWGTINRLFGLGARVIYGQDQGVHTSGHAYREELKLMLALTKPRNVVPIHGDQRHLVLFSDLAVEMGVSPGGVFILNAGQSAEFRGEKAYRGPNVPAGAVNVDGLGVGDVGEVVLKDRLLLSQEGIFLPVVVVDRNSWELLHPVEIYSRGFVYMDEATPLLEDCKAHLQEVFDEYHDAADRDWEELYSVIRAATAKFLNNLTGRRPMVLPVILPVGAEEDAEHTASRLENLAHRLVEEDDLLDD